MLTRGSRRLVPIVGSLLFLIFLVIRFYYDGLSSMPLRSSSHQQSLPDHPSHSNVDETHLEVFSVSTADRKYFLIDFADQGAMNPNIIPHPFLEETWVIIAQQIESSVPNTVWFAELVCNAVFKHGKLGCTEPPKILPIASTFGDKCGGDLAYFTLNVGPHDARVFYGPAIPYVIYGSNSVHSCFGMWMQDFRGLVDWGFEMYVEGEFRRGTDLQKPGAYRDVEKNWFIFWDTYEQMHVHYDVFPKRVFAKLEYNGSVGQNLAPLAAHNDEKCMASYLPKIGPELESIHQATNSLSITLCKRSDPTCEVNESNTFVLTIFQHKTYFSFHSVYEPYVMLLQQTAPFEIHGISRRPIWVHGRGKPFEGEKPDSLTVQASKPWDHTEMFYITSLSWKKRGQKYHGYIDDVLFISFGIEDARSGGIDVLAGDLLTDLRLCSQL